MKARITGSIDRLDIKRLGASGLHIDGNCPKCGHPWSDTLTDQPCYPRVNAPGAVPFYGCCAKCDHEWEVRLTITLVVAIHDE